MKKLLLLAVMGMNLVKTEPQSRLIPYQTTFSDRAIRGPNGQIYPIYKSEKDAPPAGFYESNFGIQVKGVDDALRAIRDMDYARQALTPARTAFLNTCRPTGEWSSFIRAQLTKRIHCGAL